jgi:FkbM family methyltransferase
MSIKKKMKKQPVFWLIFGQETSLRFHIAGEIYTLVRFPWQTIKKLSRKLTGRSAHIRIGKSIMGVPVDMFWAFVDGDYYEKNVSHWLTKILVCSKNKVFYDIGANYGYYCLKLAGSANHIYAFEPISQTNNILLKNILSNNLNNISVYKLGLSDTKRSMEMNVYSSSGNNSLFSGTLPKYSSAKLIGREVIELVTLDSLFQDERLRPPDLIKIDIEGGELYALKGAREIIKKYQPALLLECWEPLLKAAGYSQNELLTELKRYNYIIYGLPEDVTDLNVYPLTQFDVIEIAHIIALPESMEDLTVYTELRE